LTWAAFALCALLAALPVSATTIALDPAEDLAYSKLPPRPFEALLSGCLDGLFAAGCIATNAAPSSGTRADWEAAAYGLSAARAGYVDYLVAIWAEWKSSAFRKDTWIPASVAYRIVRVSDGQVLASGSIPGPADSPAAAADAPKTAEAVGRSLAAACLGLIGPRSNGGH
jgi:hypothetical protein